MCIRDRVFTLRTVEDTLRIRRFVEDQKPKTAVLAGGGLIGLEMAENLVEMRFGYHCSASEAAISAAGCGYGELCPCGNAQTRRGSAVG